MTTSTIQSVQTLIGYNFGNPRILDEALQAAGPPGSYIGNRYNSDGNKRLAILGDSILKVIVMEDWYQSGESRGRANELITNVGSNTNLDRIGRQNGLDTFIRVNNSQGRTISPVTMTATVEALLGAVYLDGDLQAVKQVMQALGII